MNKKKYVAGIFTAFALAISAGCQSTKPVAADGVTVDFPLKISDDKNITVLVDLYTVKLKDPSATDIDWQQLEKDVVIVDPNAEILSTGGVEQRLNKAVTPEVLEKALAMQGATLDESDSFAFPTVNGVPGGGRFSTISGYLYKHQCFKDEIVPAQATFGYLFKATPYAGNNGYIILSYEANLLSEITVPDCKNYPETKILPGAGEAKYSGISVFKLGGSLLLSRMNGQSQDPVTQGYMNPPKGEVKILIAKPEIDRSKGKSGMTMTYTTSKINN